MAQQKLYKVLIATRNDARVQLWKKQFKRNGLALYALIPSKDLTFAELSYVDIIVVDAEDRRFGDERGAIIRVLSGMVSAMGTRKKIIAIMDHNDPVLCRRVRELGGDGYIHRDMNDEAIIKKIKGMIEGKFLFYEV